MGMPIAITGLGAISAAGRGADALTAALAGGADGLRLITDPGMPLAASFPVGAVRDFHPPGSRNAALALSAAREAVSAAGLTRLDAIGLAIGSCTGGMRESETRYLTEGSQALAPVFAHHVIGRVTDQVATELGVSGPLTTHAEACASAACALAEAAEWIRAGLTPAVVVVGTDALTRLTLAGFASLQVIDRAGCRPFIRERAGMSLGEGACALVIEDSRHARARGATIHASLLGWGLTSDGFHATAPDPSGAWLERAIRAALADGGVGDGEIGYVSAHGTGTIDNDACEAITLARVFGAIPVASSKRCIGHTMGAAAAFGVFAAVQAIARQELLPSAGADQGTLIGGVDIVRARRSAPLGATLATSLAFGGVNAAILIGGAERCR